MERLRTVLFALPCSAGADGEAGCRIQCGHGGVSRRDSARAGFEAAAVEKPFFAGAFVPYPSACEDAAPPPGRPRRGGEDEARPGVRRQQDRLCGEPPLAGPESETAGEQNRVGRLLQRHELRRRRVCGQEGACGADGGGAPSPAGAGPRREHRRLQPSRVAGRESCGRRRHRPGSRWIVTTGF